MGIEILFFRIKQKKKKQDNSEVSKKPTISPKYYPQSLMKREQSMDNFIKEQSAWIL
tara:strand:+ start:535 stop:705 length:171 start_codon:yes stop_codon:yes gene_type:complete